MDIERIGKQMLEALAVQGQVSALESKVSNLSRQAADAAEDIQKSKDKKAACLQAREQAEGKLSEANLGVGAAQVVLRQAQSNLKSARESVQDAVLEVDKYGDVAMKKLDADTSSLEAVEAGIKASEVDAYYELTAARKDLDSRQAELKRQNIELNIGKRQSKTTVL